MTELTSEQQVLAVKEPRNSVQSVLDIPSRVKPEELGQTLIVLAGEVGSHKFEIAERLKSHIGSEMVAFVDYLQRVVKRNKLEDDYKTLQDLGLQTITEAGWQRYCHLVISRFPDADSLVVDGLRHVGAVRTLRQMSRPRDVFLIYIEATREQQRENLRQKLESKGRDPALIPSIINHPVEAEGGLVRYLADTRVKSEADRDRVLADITELIEKKRAGEREWVFRRVNISASLYEKVIADSDRYESLREVVRLLSSVAGQTAALDDWLKVKRPGLSGYSALDSLVFGNPEDAIKEALGTLERI